MSFKILREFFAMWCHVGTFSDQYERVAALQIWTHLLPMHMGLVTHEPSNTNESHFGGKMTSSTQFRHIGCSFFGVYSLPGEHCQKIELFLSLFEITSNQSSLNRGLSLDFWWLRSANYVRFREEWMMCTEKYVFAWKMFTNGLNMSLPLCIWVKKRVHGVETYWLFGK